MPPRVGVVVPCKDEGTTIERCLLALRAQDPAPDRIVVVDNGSTDGSLEIARRLADEVLEVPEGRISTLRNLGAKAVGDAGVVAFVDADCEVAPGWLAAALAALEHADLVGSRSLAAPDAPWVAARWAVVEERTAHGASLLWSQHLAARADTFARLGGFDEGRPTGEDVDTSRRVQESGGRVEFVPGMVAVHHGFPADLPRFLRRERWHTRAPGWYGRMSRKSRLLVLAAAGWGAVGAVAATSGRRPATAWAAGSTVAVPVVGAIAGRSWRHALPDGLLLSLWATVRVLRLPPEVGAALSRRRGAR